MSDARRIPRWRSGWHRAGPGGHAHRLAEPKSPSTLRCYWSELTIGTTGTASPSAQGSRVRLTPPAPRPRRPTMKSAQQLFVHRLSNSDYRVVRMDDWP